MTRRFTEFSVKMLSLRILALTAIVAIFPRVALACPEARTCHLTKKESTANVAMPCHSAKKANTPVRVANAKSCECCLQTEIQRDIKHGYDFRPGLTVIQADPSSSIGFRKNLSQGILQKPKLLFARNRIFLDKAVLLL